MKAVVIKVNHGQFELELEWTRFSAIHVPVTRAMVESEFLMMAWLRASGFTPKGWSLNFTWSHFTTTVTSSRRN